MFSRVTPRQKKILVAALQTRGHKVAMTGDGVNDLPAMRQADCSAAMGNGSDTAKQTAQLVLLDSDFAVLKDVISEGRRVINNLTKSAGVFFAAPHLGLIHAQMNLVMSLAVGIASLAGVLYSPCTAEKAQAAAGGCAAPLRRSDCRTQ